MNPHPTGATSTTSQPSTPAHAARPEPTLPPPFRAPPVWFRADGQPRRVGVELEFSSLSPTDTATTVRAALGGRITVISEAEQHIEVPTLGGFQVELDWAFLKRKARELAPDEPGHEWLQPLSEAAQWLVPVEVVCPPLPFDQLPRLTPLIDALREAGATGTDDSPIAAYGVHLNCEIPAPDGDHLDRYLRAFALLQWWLVDRQHLDLARRLSPYIDLWGEDYLCHLLAQPGRQRTSLIDDYLAFNPSRNRALDLLPLFAAIDEARVRKVVDDPRIKARPAFHYRLPDCRIEQPDWSLADAWNPWCAVETLAADRPALDRLGHDFLAARQPLIGVIRRDWVAHVDAWAHASGSA